MKLVGLLLFALSLSLSQTLSLSGPAAAVKPGQPVTLNINLSGASGKNLTAFQSSIPLPAGITAGGCTPNSSARQIACTPFSSPTFTIIAYSPANSVLADGVVGSLQFTLSPTQAPGNTALNLFSIIAVDTNSTAVPVVSGIPFGLNVANPCDANLDGKLDGTDISATINAILNKTGAVDLDGNGVSDVTDLVRVINAVLGSGCRIGA